MSAWKKQIVAAQKGCCIICGEPTFPTQRSWDHLVPAAYSGRSNKGLRFGLDELAHQCCNTRRGHEPPTPEMLARIAGLYADLKLADIEAVGANIGRVLDEQRAYVSILEELKSVLVEAAKPGAPAPEIEALQSGERPEHLVAMFPEEFHG
jgi:hypothetical protein